MKIGIQGNEKQCLLGIKKLQKNLRILKISDFQPLKDNSLVGRVYVEVGELLVKATDEEVI